MCEPLLDVAMLYVDEATRAPLPPDVSSQIRASFKQVILGSPPDDLMRLLVTHLASADPLDRISAILAVPSEPPLAPPEEPSESPASLRRKPRPWTASEDVRLLAGIHRFGLNDWATIAHFVGGGRQRSQCVQRWTRGLDPRLAKTPWTPEEERKLLIVMRELGHTAWTRISAAMGDRSDTQCRYHFSQMTRYGKVPREFLPPRKPVSFLPENVRDDQASSMAWRRWRMKPQLRIAAQPEPPAPPKAASIDRLPNEPEEQEWSIQFDAHPIDQWWKNDF
jgi:hypothetical protein